MIVLREPTDPRLPCTLATHKRMQRFANKNKVSLKKATEMLMKLAFQKS